MHRVELEHVVALVLGPAVKNGVCEDPAAESLPN
jgi:hypothetical protein